MADSGMVVSCQILTFCRCTPLLLDPHGAATHWLRAVSGLWTSQGSILGYAGRPQSDLLPEGQMSAWTDGSVWGSYIGTDHRKSGGICEASIKNTPKMLRMLTLAAEEGLVAIVHDVDSLNALEQIPAQLLALPADAHKGAEDSRPEPLATVGRGGTTMVLALDMNDDDDRAAGHSLAVHEAFRLVLVTPKITVPQNIMARPDIGIISFNLIQTAIESRLLRQIVHLENSNLREELDTHSLQQAQATLDLSTLDREMLVHLSSSEGALINDASALERVSSLRHRQEELRRSLAISQERLDAGRRAEEPLKPLAAAAAHVHEVAQALARGFQDNNFMSDDLNVLQAVVSRCLASPEKTKGADHLSQTEAAIRFECHRTICLALSQQHRRIFTLLLTLTHMQRQAIARPEEVTILLAIFSGEEELVHAAIQALETAATWRKVDDRARKTTQSHSSPLQSSDYSAGFRRPSTAAGGYVSHGISGVQRVGSRATIGPSRLKTADKEKEKLLTGDRPKLSSTSHAALHASAPDQRPATRGMKGMHSPLSRSGSAGSGKSATANKSLIQTQVPVVLSWMDSKTWVLLQTVCFSWPGLQHVPATMHAEAMALSQDKHVIRGTKHEVHDGPTLVGPWFNWASGLKPEAEEPPQIYLDDHSRTHMRLIERLVLAVVLRFDRLHAALDHLVESVLGNAYLQATSNHSLSKSFPSDSQDVLLHMNTLFLAEQPPSAIVLQVEACDSTESTALLTQSAQRARARILVCDVSLAAATFVEANPLSNDPTTDQAQAHISQLLSSLQDELDMLRQEKQNVAGGCVWIVIKCTPFTLEAADVVADALQELQPLQSLSVWLLVDTIETLNTSLLCCPRILARCHLFLHA